MKKKILAIALIMVMLSTIVVPALAAGETVTTSMSGNKVTITVKSGNTELAKVTVDYVKNAKLTYDVGDFKVEVEYNGSGVKSAKIVSSPSSPTPPPPANNGNSGTNNNYVGGVGVKVDKNNANFHCNAFGGNGRVWPEKAINKETGVITNHDFKKTPFMFYFDRVGTSTKWTLNHVRDEKGNAIIGSVICPVCGSTQWISYSNNSGAPDGKNIQLQHPLTSIKIVKKWLDAEGKPSNGTSVKFDINYNIEGKTGKMTVGPGEVKNLPAGTYVIKELDIANYTLIEILTRAGFVVDLAAKTATIVITPEMALADDIVTVTFTNHEDPYVIIDKKWADGNPGKIKAKFDIYKLGECDDDCEEDCEIIHRGALVRANAEAGVKYYLAEGLYVVAELTKSYVKPAILDDDGNVAVRERTVTYEPQPDQIIEIKWGNIAYVTFTNTPVRWQGSLRFTKRVEGINIGEWLMAKYNGDVAYVSAILEGLEFYLDGVIDSYGPTYPDMDGMVVFPFVEPGIYILSEEVTGAAAGKFTAIDPMKIEVLDGEDKFVVIDGGHNTFGIDGDDFWIENEPFKTPGGFSFEKKVEGKGIVEWLTDKGYATDEITAIREGLEFYLDGVNGNYGPVSPDQYGKVAFPNIEPGIYVLSEEVTGAAVGKFAAIDDMTIEILEGENKFIVIDGGFNTYGSGGSGLNSDFDYGALYAGIWGPQPEASGGAYFNLSDEAKAKAGDSMDFLKNGNGNGYDFVNNYFDNFHVRNVAEASPAFDSEYSSFCADWYSGGLVQYPFYVDKSDVRFAGEDGAAVKANIIKAFNYIISEYGDLEWRTNKLIANYVLWILLDDGVIDIIAKDEPAITAAIEDVLANYSSFEGAAAITDIVFLAAENYVFPHKEYLSHQPQLVPIGGGDFWIENEPINPQNGRLRFEKRVEGKNIVQWLTGEGYDAFEILAILEGLEFCLDGDNGSYGPVTPDPDGMVVFNDIEPGIYILSEEVTGAAVGKFKKMDDIEIEIFPGVDSYFILGGTVTLIGLGDGGFDMDAPYEAHLGAGMNQVHINGGQWWTIYNFAVENLDTNEFFPSYCAYWGSAGVGEIEAGKTWALATEKQAEIRGVINYIYEKYGSYDAWAVGGDGFPIGDDPVTNTKLVAQIAIWLIIGDGLEDVTLLDRPALNAAVQDALANGRAATGPVNIVFLAGADYPDDANTNQPQIVPFMGGFYVENEPEITIQCSLSFEKKVEDKNIVEWLTDKGYDTDEIQAILDGLEFYLDGDDSYGPVTPDLDGMVVFANIKPGTYKLSEEVTGAAVGKFKKMDDIPNIVIALGDNKFFVLGGTVTGNIDGTDIIAGDIFTVYNGYGQFDWGYDDSGIGYPGLNATGHIFYIGVDNVRTGQRLHSYCANAGSTAFGPGPYLIAHSVYEIDWIEAFNYIFDNYGDLNENRVITQVITWALLGAVDVYDLDQTKLKDEEKAAIIDVWENYSGYVGEGNVVDVLFMVDENTPFTEAGLPDYSAHQPQIVPIIGTFYVKNEPE